MRETTSSTTVAPGDRPAIDLDPGASSHRLLRLVLFGLGLVATMVGAVALPIWLVP